MLTIVCSYITSCSSVVKNVGKLYCLFTCSFISGLMCIKQQRLEVDMY